MRFIATNNPKIGPSLFTHYTSDNEMQATVQLRVKELEMPGLVGQALLPALRGRGRPWFSVT